MSVRPSAVSLKEWTGGLALGRRQREASEDAVSLPAFPLAEPIQLCQGARQSWLTRMTYVPHKPVLALPCPSHAGWPRQTAFDFNVPGRPQPRAPPLRAIGPFHDPIPGAFGCCRLPGRRATRELPPPCRQRAYITALPPWPSCCPRRIKRASRLGDASAKICACVLTRQTASQACLRVRPRQRAEGVREPSANILLGAVGDLGRMKLAFDLVPEYVKRNRSSAVIISCSAQRDALQHSHADP
jgi:hypothetical protein